MINMRFIACASVSILFINLPGWQCLSICTCMPATMSACLSVCALVRLNDPSETDKVTPDGLFGYTCRIHSLECASDSSLYRPIILERTHVSHTDGDLFQRVECRAMHSAVHIPTQEP